MEKGEYVAHQRAYLGCRLPAWLLRRCSSLGPRVICRGDCNGAGYHRVSRFLEWLEILGDGSALNLISDSTGDCSSAPTGKGGTSMALRIHNIRLLLSGGRDLFRLLRQR